MKLPQLIGCLAPALSDVPGVRVSVKFGADHPLLRWRWLPEAWRALRRGGETLGAVSHRNADALFGI